MKYCAYCAEESQDDAIFCQNCGNRFAEISKQFTPPVTPPKKNSSNISDFWNSGKKGKIIIGCGSISILTFLCLVAFILFTPSSSSNATETTPEDGAEAAITTATDASAPAAAPDAVLDPVAELGNQVAAVLGSSNRGADPRLINFSTIDNTDGNISYTLMFTANDNLNTSLIKRGIMMDIEKILKTIDTSELTIPYKYIFMYVRFPLVDAYGNIEDNNIVVAAYERESIEKINWDHFITDNIFTIAVQDKTRIHQALLEED